MIVFHMASSATGGIGYKAAWEAWAHHQDISMRALWHIPIFWWGRIGKVLELAGGTTVVATIVGPDRLNAVAKGLRENDVRRLAGRLRAKMPAWWRRYLNTIKGPAVQAIMAVVSLFGAVFFLILGILNGVVSGKTLLSGGPAYIANASATATFAVLLVPVVGLALILVVVVVGYALDFLVARPLAIGVKTATRESVVQGIGLLLLAMGIHFDVLSV
jgi:hypothetical protein